MTSRINRREWLRSAALLGAGAAGLPAIGRSLAPLTSTGTQVASRLKSIDFPFSPAEPGQLIRLNANENPYGPAPATRLTIMEAVARGNRYGHGEAGALRAAIAQKEGVPEDHILLGPGSTDLLEKTAIVTFTQPGGEIVSADPSYMSIINTAQVLGARWKPVPLTPSYAHDLTAMEAAVNAKTQLVYICNPNNPTGSITPAADLRAFCARVSEKAPVFVDEAYLEFLDNPVASSMVDLAAAGKQVIVARTFSKIHGMAGLRIGYLVAPPALLQRIETLTRTNMGLCITSILGASASLGEKEFQAACRTQTAEARNYVTGALTELGFEYIPSHTSFILFPIPIEGKVLLQKMYEAGIGVRAFTIDGKPYCRVSMGLPGELERFVESLRRILV